MSLKTARQAGVCRDYLRRAEQHGCPARLAERLADLYRCRVELSGGGPSLAYCLDIREGKPRTISRASRADGRPNPHPTRYAPRTGASGPPHSADKAAANSPIELSPATSSES